MLYYIHFLPLPHSFCFGFGLRLLRQRTLDMKSHRFFRKSWGIGVPPPKDLQWVQNHIGGRFGTKSVSPSVSSRSVNNSDPPTPHPTQPYCASAAPTCLAPDIAEG